MAEIGSGTIDVVVVYRLTRIWRLIEQQTSALKKFRESGVALHTTDEGSLNFSSADGQFMVGVGGLVANQETNLMSERMSRAHYQRAQRGEYRGPKPFGYKKVPGGHLEILADEAAAITDAVSQVLNGTSLSSIARQWNESSLRPLGGGRWTMTEVRRIIMMWEPWNG